jgi:hypothetical protein
MYQETFEVRFCGGPLDGHVQKLQVPEEQLIESATFPINRNLFRLMSRHPAGKPHPVTSIASYKLSREDGEYRYLFEGAVAPMAKVS